ncbi:MAG: methylenetetrahydrofolate--tRNA-(uracil(54)-C(5))-methyltransferase (FADH(2)-oxidizing) TrmFO [Vicinamibacteria bacterium]|nr:methylenetetrahydrofolate--tRNA-(uracil(54)-C(5))-methyltransferase (FADH(2)-oxidizing) TrmFO [Vicinamibacteria bacterium]
MSKDSEKGVIVVGAGLAGCEAAWQIASRGTPVMLFEMRPQRMTPAHCTGDFAELVCSNSLRGNALDQAAGLLKEEMRRLGSMILRVADEVHVPGGSALAVDRALFARRVTETLTSHPLIEIERREVVRIPDAPVVVLATGPLTSDSLAACVAAFVGEPHLCFYDAISPIVEAGSIEISKAFWGSRYGKGGDDYVNCPLDEEQYRTFHDALVAAERVAPRDFEEERHFEGCLPIEVMARRGRDTLRFGPLKPVGLTDPRSGKRPFAVVQLRQDDLARSHYSLVGFQTRLTRPEQRRVFRMIPALARAEFARFGQIHRNTYINAPRILEPTFEARRRTGLFVAGQVSGVEGYVESAASGLMAGMGARLRFLGRRPLEFPPETALGALGIHVSRSNPKAFHPVNIAFGLLPEPLNRVRDRRRRRLAVAQRAIESLADFAALIDADVVKEEPSPASRGAPVTS